MRSLPLIGAVLPLTGKLSFGHPRSATHVHRGADLPRAEGTPVYAVADGIVEHASAAWAQGFSGYGAHVVIRHARAWSLSAHLNATAVHVGERVLAGELVGHVGRTQFSRTDHASLLSGPHLHFEISPTRYPQTSEAPRLDPRAWLALAVDPRIASAIAIASRVTGVDVALLRALAFAASRWNASFSGTRVIGAGVARGLFALSGDAASLLGVRDPLDAVQSAHGAAVFLKSLLARFATADAALAAYVWQAPEVESNAGAGHWPAAVRTFVSAVRAQYEIELTEVAPAGARPLAVPFREREQSRS